MAVGQGEEERFLPFRPGRFLSGFDGQRDAGGMDAKRSPQQDRYPPAGEPSSCGAQLRFKRQEVAAELRRRPGTELAKNGNTLLHQSWHLHGELMATAKLVKQNLGAIGLAQIAPIRHFDKEPEADGESWIQRLGREILLLVVFAIWRLGSW